MAWVGRKIAEGAGLIVLCFFLYQFLLHGGLGMLKNFGEELGKAIGAKIDAGRSTKNEFSTTKFIEGKPYTLNVTLRAGVPIREQIHLVRKHYVHASILGTHKISQTEAWLTAYGNVKLGIPSTAQKYKTISGKIAGAPMMSDGKRYKVVINLKQVQVFKNLDLDKTFKSIHTKSYSTAVGTSMTFLEQSLVAMTGGIPLLFNRSGTGNGNSSLSTAGLVYANDVLTNNPCLPALEMKLRSTIVASYDKQFNQDFLTHKNHTLHPRRVTVVWATNSKGLVKSIDWNKYKRTPPVSKDVVMQKISTQSCVQVSNSTVPKAVKGKTPPNL